MGAGKYPDTGSGRIVHLISGAFRYRPDFKNCSPVSYFLSAHIEYHDYCLSKLKIGMRNSLIADSCTILGSGGWEFCVSQLNDALEFFLRPNLLAMVTKIWEY